MRIAVDTGGTFTDVVDESGRIAKVPSTPDDPGRGLRDAIAALGMGRPRFLAHGTTVATNALLEGTGAPVHLLATAGFGDEIEIARQARPSLYDPNVVRPPALVPRDRRIDVRERVAADGTVLVPLALDALPTLPRQAVVAICLLHADLYPHHERVLRDHLVGLGHDVTCSHEVSPEHREYERMVTTVANASLRPACAPYLRALDAVADVAAVMTSAGLLRDARAAAEVPAALLLSGPAGGVRAAAAIAQACGVADAVAFDMGGTSTDVCLVRGGVPEPAPMLHVGGYPIRLPALAIHTIGAGGGSIAELDPGGALAVGPRSAGARPGPIAYGHGGTRPTVTDADLVCGRIPAEHAFPGLGRLDVDAARDAFAHTGIDPAGVLRVVDARMAEAVRAVTVARGVDPRSVALVAFGGAGPLHACAVADELGIPTVIVPPRAGVFSAVGLLGAPRGEERVASLGDTTLHDAVARVAADARSAVHPDADVVVAYDCRYTGQGHEITVADPAAFHGEHERRNGYAQSDRSVEIVAVRARATLAAGVAIDALGAPERADARGPCVIAEPDCTVWLPAGWEARVGPLGAWILERA